MNVGELLANSLSPDAPTRQLATEKLESASLENYPAYMRMLSAELVNDNSQPHIRNAAGIALKNALTAREAKRQTEYHNRWLSTDPETRSKVKQEAVMALSSSNPRVGQVAAQTVAAIAAVELPMNQWMDVVDMLLQIVQQSNQIPHRVSSLQAIGYICESVKPEVLALRSNDILTAVIHGARKDEPSAEVQQAAINSLYNSLEFVRANFEREGERNYIMQVVCEATQSSSVQVQVGAFECLVRIMSLYYEKMGFYMERALFGLTVLGMKNSEEAVALQAIEFWSTVCEEETELAIEAAEAAEYGEVPETENKNFAKLALAEIMPVLLALLLKQEEDADEDEWNVSMAAGTCLSLLATAVTDAIVPAVIPFIEANIKASDWHHREAAVMAFGSILDGPDPGVISPLVAQALPLLIDMMRDTNPHVKDSTAWTLGRITDLLIGTIIVETHLHPLVSALVTGLEETPRVIANCCWGLMNLADQLGEYTDDDTAASRPGPLTPFYEGIVAALLRLTEKPSNEANFRTSAYETLSSYVQHASQDTIHIVSNITMTSLGRMEHLLSIQNQIVGIDDRTNWNDLQGNLCSVILSVIRKMGDKVQPLADRIMTLILQLIQAAGRQATVLEDAFLVVGGLASALEQHFVPYVGAFLPFLYPALKAHEDTQLCSVATGIIGDICRALGPQSIQYAREFMTVLLENLQSDVLSRDVKIPIISCFGDIALATGAEFAPYLDTTMGVLRQAGSIEPNPLDFDLIEYVNLLREGILEAYVGIVSAFRGTDKGALLLPHVSTMLELVQRSLQDEEKTDIIIRQAIGLVGDLADSYPHGEIKDLLLQEWVAQALRPKSRHSYGSETRRTLKWARDLVKRATLQNFVPASSK